MTTDLGHRERVIDPAAFVAEAERITNERDVDAITDVFAPDATWTTVLDGTEMVATGHDEIRATWAVL